MLRFPILRGEYLRLRAVGTDGQPLTCQEKLVSVGDDEVQFSARCSEQLTTSLERNCPSEPSSAKAEVGTASAERHWFASVKHRMPLARSGWRVRDSGVPLSGPPNAYPRKPVPASRKNF